MLHTLFRWTLNGILNGIMGYLVFILASIGYTIGACFYVTALLKPFFPHNVGLFVGEQGINLARFPIPPSGIEVLGTYYIPVAVFVGYLFTFATTLGIRFVIRRLGRLKQRVAGLSASA
jgi:hypothetical protein